MIVLPLSLNDWFHNINPIIIKKSDGNHDYHGGNNNNDNKIQ